MSDLENLLAKEKELVVRFLDALRQEQAALVEGNAEALKPIGETKLHLVGELNGIEAERATLLPLTAEKGGMMQWLKQHPNESNARNLWLKIMSLSRVARQMHEMNGELITLHLAKTNEALAILTQRQRDVALYGSDGQSSGGTGSRIVDLA